MDVSGFWNGDGFQLLLSAFGQHVAGVIVLLVAIVYFFWYFDVFARRPQSGALDSDVASTVKSLETTSTDIRHLKGRRK